MDDTSTKQARHTLQLRDFVEFGVLVLLFLIPFHSVLVLPNVSILKATGLALVSLWILWLLTKLNTIHNTWVIAWPNFRIVIAIILFIANIIISGLYEELSPIYTASLITILLNFGMVFVIFTVISSSERSLVRAYKWLAIGGIPAAILVILDYFNPQEIKILFGQKLFTMGFEIRATGAFRDPNYGAFILIIFACLLFYFALNYQKRWQRIILFIGVIIEIIAILLTFSRSAYILLMVLGLIILWSERGRFKFWKIILINFAFVFMLFVIIGSKIPTLIIFRVNTLVEAIKIIFNNSEQLFWYDQSLWFRFQLLLVSFRIIFSKFPLGIGWQNFKYNVAQYSATISNLGAHNTYTAVFTELGLPGFLALLWLFKNLWISMSLLNQTTTGRIRYLARGTRFALLAILIGGLFLTIFHEAIVWALFGLIMAQNQIVFKNITRKECINVN